VHTGGEVWKKMCLRASVLSGNEGRYEETATDRAVLSKQNEKKSGLETGCRGLRDLT